VVKCEPSYSNCARKWYLLTLANDDRVEEVGLVSEVGERGRDAEHKVVNLLSQSFYTMILESIINIHFYETFSTPH